MDHLPGVVVVFVLLLSACSTTPLPAPTQPLPAYPILLSPSPVSESAYPPPGGAAPTPEPLPLLTVIPTPSTPDKATITGVLLLNPGSPLPATGVILALANIVPEAKGTPWVAGFERLSAPQTQTDGAGRFVFVDIAPGKYALVLDRLNEAYLLGNPKDGADLILGPQPGQVLDLGDLIYASLPGVSPTP